MPDDAMITVNKVTRRFRRIVAIDSLSLTVNRGELFGILGPDGSGKTTLLRLMAGVLDPSPHGQVGIKDRLVAVLHPPIGHIHVGGVDTVKQSETVKSHLGYMPQAFGLYGDLSVDENLTFAADVFGVYGSERSRRIKELLEFAELGQFRSRRARQLSGGMKKKLALACVLLHRPDVLLLDEPTTGVDPVARRDFWDLLSGLHADGVTTVVSTPYMDEAERCNRAALLYEGRLLADGTPESIKKRVPGQVLALHDVDIRAAANAVKDLPGLLEIQTYGDQLNLLVNGDLDMMQRQVRTKLADQGLTVENIVPMSVRMEEAFIYLIGTERGRQKGGAV